VKKSLLIFFLSYNTASILNPTYYEAKYAETLNKPECADQLSRTRASYRNDTLKTNTTTANLNNPISVDDFEREASKTFDNQRIKDREKQRKLVYTYDHELDIFPKLQA
jgi:hypothetical protein